MSTNLERMEDDIQAMVENLVSEALATALTRLDERIEKIERFIANLGPLALLSERLTRCEGLLVHHGLDIETNSMNVEALVEEHKLQGTINASLQGQINGINERIEGAEEKVAEMQEQWPNALLNRLAIQCGHFENAINLMATRRSALEQQIAVLENNVQGSRELVEPEALIITGPLSAGELAQAQALAPNFDHEGEQ